MELTKRQMEKMKDLETAIQEFEREKNNGDAVKAYETFIWMIVGIIRQGEHPLSVDMIKETIERAIKQSNFKDNS